MKRFWVEIQVGLLVITGVALVLAMGYLAYTGMSSILSSVTRESKPDVKLNMIQMLATDLEKAESSIRVYAFSRSERDLKPYRDLLKGLDGRMEGLRDSGSGNPEFLANLDTIGDLITQKVLLWQEMLPLYTVKETEKYLDTISRELENKIVSDSLRRNRSLLKKIFQRSEKVELDEERMVRDIEQAKVEDSERTTSIRDKELRLAAAGSRLTRQFYVLVSRIEEAEYAARRERASEADRMAEETYKWIGWFSLSATLALLLVIFVITRYIRKSHAYQLALVKARKEAETLARAKEMFVANVSHELRTPMNVISGFVDQLLMRKQDKETGDTLRIIKSSSDHLVRIVNDILDFSKLESGKMKLEPLHFNARELFHEMVLLFGGAGREKEVTFEVTVGEEVPEYLFGDPIRLKQILINLSGNALKFTEKGSVTLSVAAGNQVAGHLDLKITVRDTGIGIAPEKLDMIFEDFTQAEAGTTQKFGGTGLGLSIVRKLVDLHGGEIKVSSTPGAGTTFMCRLPYRKGRAEETVKRAVRGYRIPDAVRELNVLIVDDEVYNRKLVGAILGKWQVPHREAGTGEEALEMAAGEHFDLILMDNRMPGMDGLETSRKILASAGGKQNRPAIISFTAANVSREMKKEYQKAGIESYLSKPFTEDELLRLLLSQKGIGLHDLEALPEEPPADTGEGTSAIDLQQLYRVAGDDEGFVMEMLERFIESFDAGYENMARAIAREAWPEAGDAAHKLASPTRHLGAEDLLAGLKAIEQEAGEDEVTADFGAMAQAVKKEYDRVRQQIIQHLETKKD